MSHPEAKLANLTISLIKTGILGGIGPCTVLKPSDAQIDNKQIHYILSAGVDATVPKGSFRIVIVNQKKSWEKAVRVYNKGNNDWFEVKCGDKSGKVCRTNANVKFDDKNVPIDGTNDVTLTIMKPGTLGVWTAVFSLKIPNADLAQYNQKTLYLYFDNDDDRFFDLDANKVIYNNLV